MYTLEITNSAEADLDEIADYLGTTPAAHPLRHPHTRTRNYGTTAKGNTLQFEEGATVTVNLAERTDLKAIAKSASPVA